MGFRAPPEGTGLQNTAHGEHVQKSRAPPVQKSRGDRSAESRPRGDIPRGQVYSLAGTGLQKGSPEGTGLQKVPVQVYSRGDSRGDRSAVPTPSRLPSPEGTGLQRAVSRGQVYRGARGDRSTETPSRLPRRGLAGTDLHAVPRGLQSRGDRSAVPPSRVQPPEGTGLQKEGPFLPRGQLARKSRSRGDKGPPSRGDSSLPPGGTGLQIYLVPGSRGDRCTESPVGRSRMGFRGDRSAEHGPRGTRGTRPTGTGLRGSSDRPATPHPFVSSTICRTSTAFWLSSFH